MPDLVALILVIAGLYLIFVGPNLYAMTVIQVAGQQFSSSNAGIALIFLAVITLVTNGSVGGLTTFSAERLKSQYLRVCTLLILGSEVSLVFFIRSLTFVIIMFISTIVVLVLLGGFVIPKLLKMDSALELARSQPHSR